MRVRLTYGGPVSCGRYNKINEMFHLYNISLLHNYMYTGNLLNQFQASSDIQEVLIPHM